MKCAGGLEDWLRGLDSSGALVRYLPKLQSEFTTLAELAAAKRTPPNGAKGALASIEPSVFEALEIQSLGHRLAVARGILALAEQEKEEEMS